MSIEGRGRNLPVASVYECRASTVWKAPDREIGKPGENRGKVIAHRDLQPTEAFHNREKRRNLGPAWGLPKIEAEE